MDSSNPFSGLTRSRSERKLIDRGIYESELSSVKSVQVTDKKTQEKRTKVVFTFKLDSGSEVSQFFSPSMSDLSHLVKFLKTIGGDGFTPEIQNNADSLWQYCKGLEGQRFQIVVTVNNGYNNIDSAMPMKPAKTESAPVSVSVDEFEF